jgi:uncharacterized protein (TIGR00730 family)
MKSVAVFCASAYGNNPIYRTSAYTTGKILAQRGMDVLYGGSKLGLMGDLADGALEAGGKVIGVLPEFLRDREVAHMGISELILVKSMHERKKILNDRSDAILTLPGGFGTMEEFFELLTWSQLGLHSKPIGILNVNGVYDPLMSLFDRMVDEGFVRSESRNLVLIDSDLDSLLDAMNEFVAPARAKVIDAKTV